MLAGAEHTLDHRRKLLHCWINSSRCVSRAPLICPCVLRSARDCCPGGRLSPSRRVGVRSSPMTWGAEVPHAAGCPSPRLPIPILPLLSCPRSHRSTHAVPRGTGLRTHRWTCPHPVRTRSPDQRKGHCDRREPCVVKSLVSGFFHPLPDLHPPSRGAVSVVRTGDHLPSPHHPCGAARSAAADGA